METITKTSTQAQSGEYLQQCVKEASQIITPYWPISSFIASNGLGGLENRPFGEALKQAQELRGSQGYLPLARYQEFFKQGRINADDLESAISTHLNADGLPTNLKLTERPVATQTLYKDWLLDPETPEARKSKKPEMWETVFRRLSLLNLLDRPAENEAALRKTEETAGDKTLARDGQTVTQVVNKYVITWCAAFLDEGQAAWAMPGREQGFYRAWKSLAGLDKSLRYYTRSAITKKLQTLPYEAGEAVIVLLQHLEIPPQAWTAYLRRHLAQLPGWAGIIRWRDEHPEVIEQQQHPISLVEYLAMRLFYEAVLVEAKTARAKTPDLAAAPEKAFALVEQTNAGQISRLVKTAETLNLTSAAFEALPKEIFQTLARLAQDCRPETQQAIWQTAYEWHYRQQLMQQLYAEQSKPTNFSARHNPAAQAIFCIDVRSEGLRRHLENRGAYDTYGFAGFFGIPMLYQPFGSSRQTTLGPALISVTQVIKEVPQDPTAAKRRLNYNQWRYNGRELFHGLRENLLTPFAFVEMVGWLSFFPLLGKTLMPRRWQKLQTSVQKKLTPPVSTRPSIIANPAEMSLEAQAGAVSGMLRSIGLTKQFARLVLLCGHGSETENNPYAAALDCGACGGNHGGTSAQVAASVLNSPPVRKLLAGQGIIIPEETFFLAGEHNTTTDSVSFLNEAELPQSHRAEFEQFRRELARAGEMNAAERWQRLPGITGRAQSATGQIAQRAADWAQIRPEWGLVRNAAFICGRRSLTAGLNLDNRVFLHSYDQLQDADGAILEGILTAPVVVAEWINMQYYLSSVDNQHFGSSTKLLHTVVGQVGVMQGRQSDLLSGLPQQSVMVGDELYHEPLRLCVIVEAAPAKIESIIAKHERLQHLTQNGWIALVAYDSNAKAFYQYSAKGEWLEITFDTLEEKEAAA